MNRMSKTALQIGGIIAVIAICSLVMYFIGSSMAQSLGTELSRAGRNASNWKNDYSTLILALGAVSLLVTLGWYILARFIFKVTSPQDTGKRTIWAALWLGGIALTIAITALNSLPKNFIIHIMHVLFFNIIGYYLCTLLWSPAPFKYTPLGAKQLWSKRNRGNGK
jgi:hypothetical protein